MVTKDDACWIIGLSAGAGIAASISALSDLRTLLFSAAVICGRNCLVSWVSTSSIATSISPDDGIVATGAPSRVLRAGHLSKVV